MKIQIGVWVAIFLLLAGVVATASGTHGMLLKDTRDIPKEQCGKSKAVGDKCRIFIPHTTEEPQGQCYEGKVAIIKEDLRCVYTPKHGHAISSPALFESKCDTIGDECDTWDDEMGACLRGSLEQDPNNKEAPLVCMLKSKPGDGSLSFVFGAVCILIGLSLIFIHCVAQNPPMSAAATRKPLSSSLMKDMYATAAAVGKMPGMASSASQPSVAYNSWPSNDMMF